MPVDMSMMGIQGQIAGQQLVESRERVARSQQAGQKEAYELDQLTRQQALADQAALMLSNISQGKKNVSQDTDKAAERMESMSEPLEKLAGLYMRGGAPESGMKFLQAASEIRKKESDIENDAVLAKQRKLENIVKGADVISRYLGVAKNQSEWDYGIQQLQTQGIVEPHLIQKMAEMEYNPNVAAYFKQQAISASDQARLEMQASQEARISKDSALNIAQGARRIAMQKARDEEVRRHNQQVEKATGGKSSAMVPPNSDALKSVKVALKNTVYKDIDEEGSDNDLAAAADYVATQAQQMVKQNKALDWNSAVQRAIMVGQDAGAFGLEPGKNNWFSDDEPAKAKFKSGGLNADAPLPMVKDKKALQKGRYYSTARGTAQWNGTAFVPVN